MAAVKATLDALDPSKSSQNTMKLENTDKRDTLIATEKHYQKIWQESGIFEPDAPSTTEIPLHSISPAELRKKHRRFFGTMAYPYMNGTLHAGHSFTASKIEFTAGYARMQGKRTLFPLGFHCTGMPIKACADKLEREVEMFGKTFERCTVEDITEDKDTAPAPMESDTKEDVTKFTAKKGKAAAKNIKTKYQFQIMLAIGIPLDDIHLFANPQYWLRFFPPLCKRDLNAFGARIDWRRSFVTTDANPYYDSFVRWQMNRLHELGKIKFGKRYTIFSPFDAQACMDHDRSEGEGVGVQQYIALRLKVMEWPESAQRIVSEALPSGAHVYFIPATLRPETMYGQTCCFVGPKISYGIFKVTDKEYYFMSDRAARNMAFQSIFPEWGIFPKVATLKGSDVVGTVVNAPLSVHKQGVRILPMETVKASKGTGVVTCVPSDSPDDFATVTDLAKKADYYGIKKEWAELEIIPIIETPTYGNLTAATLVRKLKINSPKDTKLAEAKDLAYKEGYYQGKMVYGDFSGKSVMEAKPLVRQSLLDLGDAFNYAEPDGFVLSRSGDECVAAHLDQWYLNYGTTENGGDGEWCQQVLDFLHSDLNAYSTEAKNGFEQNLNWLSQWACARSFGLGSKLPWDPTFLVESLSDSTIYMSYYTIAHHLHKDIFGKEQGVAGVSPEQMTDEVWDYIFTRRPDVASDIPKAKLEAMRREFEYWYPMDLRVSGKDLILNHLTFFLYIHLALFPKEYLPRGIRANGHLMLNGKKMSKSTGNFLTLSQAVEKFGADATRVALADAGDGIDDANFEEKVADTSVLRLYELRSWCEDMIVRPTLVDDADSYKKSKENQRAKNVDAIQRTGEKSFWDEIFENELNILARETQQHYEATNYKLALKSGFYDFTSARDTYREATKSAGVGMHHSLIRRYVKLQALMLTPIAPHWAEYMWLDVLKKPSTIQNELFPTVEDPIPSLTAARDYVRSTQSSITSAEGAQQKKLAKGKAVSFDPKREKRLRIFTATQYPAWQDKCVELMRQSFAELGVVDVKALVPRIAKLGETKRAMPFVNAMKRSLDGGIPAAEVFERKLAFDERAVLAEMVPGLMQTVLKCREVEIVSVDEGGKTGTVVGGSEGKNGETRDGLPSVAEAAVPGAPTFHFENL